jgi:hypothetical protein
MNATLMLRSTATSRPTPHESSVNILAVDSSNRASPTLDAVLT